MFPMASMTTETASSSSSLPQREYQYDVFLSFRGEDTRNNFTSHLYAALDKKGIKTFRDNDELERGKPIRPELLTAIEESRFAVIILSRNYASSTWCLDELEKIVECMKKTELTVLPVFYGVNPSYVRKHRRSTCFWMNRRSTYAQAFAKHQKQFKENREKVQRWRDALIEVADASGWHVKDRPEAEVIEEIVVEILDKLNSIVRPIVSDDLFGIESRVDKMLNSYLGIGVDDVRFVGICGMGGIGKTTLARAIYERITCQFEANCFLANVREEAEKNGLVALQEQLLSSTIQTKSSITIQNDYEGANAIRNGLYCKKVLIILDDVDQLEQLRALVKHRCWFGGGSRIIVTTRNKRLLIEHDVAEDGIYEAMGMNYNEALQLFCRKAFKEDSPPKDFVELSKKFLNYAKGLPLALEVLGSSLYQRSEDVWKSMLRKLKEIPDEKIHDKLQISFDGLSDLEKKIFLDIACFFKGEDKDRVEDILESFGYHPKIGIDNLINKSLITISSKRLQLHDLLEEMGREIVRRESCEEPGGRSRLWFWEDIHHVLTNNTGTERVEGIALRDGPPRLHLNAEAFLKLPNLRFLKIVCADPLSRRRPNILWDINWERLSLLNELWANEWKSLSYLPNKLRVIDLPLYPMKSLPWSFSLDKLVILDLRFSFIIEIWNKKKSLPKLKILDLSHSYDLIKTSNFTGAQNLEKLIFYQCERLYEVHPSVAGLKQLTLLNLEGCKSLTSLPCNISLDSLEILILSGCWNLEKFPEIVGDMKHLKELKLDETAIKELPLSVGRLSGLTLLNLKGCRSLTSLPCNISFDSLEILILSGCRMLKKFPEIVGDMKRLKELKLDRTAIEELPLSIGRLSGLTLLNLKGCEFLTSLPCNISLDSLEILILSGCRMLKKFPEIVVDMKRLKELKLDRTAIEELPLSIGRLSGLTLLDLGECTSLTSLPCNISLDSLETLILSDCWNLEKFPEIVGDMKRLKELKLDGTAIEELPLSVGRLSGLTLLNLKGCKSLTSLPCNISLDSLEILILSGCRKLKKFPEIVGDMKRLKELKLEWTAIKELPLSIGRLSVLTLLNLEGCKSLTSLPCNIILDSLEILILSDCWKLKKFPEIVGDMKRLKELKLDGTAIEELPLSIGRLSGLTVLDLADCKSLLTLPSVVCNLTSLQYLILFGCSKVDKLPEDLGNLKQLKKLGVWRTAIRQVPSSIQYSSMEVIWLPLV
ncbi:disease resistance protein RPV1-like [Alnus glutinosa]|uniref:disease resistance protein RPV1-like n=1 Tax=Alnus glutinosa TaxID=3517 RepID=UPI002D774ED5|nr:disease resistance protein RPV1-like [Alnus glutinosa]